MGGSPLFADVALDLPLALDKPYTYRVPERLTPDARLGSAVMVPFGPRKRVHGLVVALHDRPPTSSAREIETVLGGDWLPPGLPELIGWIAQTYLCPPLAIWRAAVPAGILARTPPKIQRMVVAQPMGHDADGSPAAMQPASARQRLVWDHLNARGGKMPVASLIRELGTTSQLIQSLAAQGWVQIVPERIWRSGSEPQARQDPPMLNAEQQAVMEALILDPPGTTLLHGITGSGKTEIYLQAIARVLQAGKGAIVLVPEIALTGQIVSRFVSRFGDQVAVLHSGLSNGERLDEWHRLRSGAARVAIGPRSAVFAPLTDLGLIVIDEEHEGSYKQDNIPRYHARTVALERARREHAAVILGSATPSIESYWQAQQGTYALAQLHHRVAGRPLPEVTIVDMRQELAEGNRSLFSRKLTVHLTHNLEVGLQAILLMNRRGYSQFVLCRTCGLAVRCPRCSVSLTYHRTHEHLRCHYCDFTQAVPTACPACQSPRIRHFGAGTQQVAEALQEKFPEARILRLDRDTTSRKGSHAKILEAFGQGEADVLIGTQMVAKGLDFPRIGLVGVLSADLSLNIPDFRAAERTFQLLTQVAGRAGRGVAGGQVIIQAYAPDHCSVQLARTHDFEAFYQQEVPEREALGYPPFGRLVNFVVSAEEAERASTRAQALASILSDCCEGGLVLGPVESSIPMLRGHHRFQVLLKLPRDVDPGPPVRAALGHLGRHEGVRVAIDVDPVNFL